MKPISLVLIYLCFQSCVSAAPLIPPTSEEWDEVYKPPYKSPTELPVGSELRKELFNQLRSELKEGTKFVGTLKAFRNWALFTGSTVNSKGQTINYPPMNNSDSIALWLRTAKGWMLVDYSFGHSDAFFVTWPEVYGTPRELLGMKPKP